MIDPAHPRLSIARQCRLVAISRSTFYGPATGESPLNLALMRLIDEPFLETPWYGSRQMARHLRREGHEVGRKRVRRLMAKIGVQAVCQRPKTSQPHPEHKVRPYLLRGLTIDRPNQVWCADITYLPMRRGFLHLVAIMDWATRKVLAWRVSNTLHADFCIEALEEALARHGPPEISTRTRAASSPARGSPTCCGTRTSASPWTAGADGWTTSSSSGSGAA
jgi:putative transposase